ncbi:uncharacterized protein Dwil_GK27083 [Drosophila willistoni]|uniref:DUF243 domain-containing protein n=1 Tax=Drosophila willistoni TaxID=7260 RepID=A0A0Q9X7C6_DROWI|nr:uncharacterized protein LOC26529085 [Drosophila willistoni]KRF99970.1 uncharacterized protein Dwil_GK27083 [Drosophila willistoni]
MRALMCLCLFIGTIDALDNAYLPASQIYAPQRPVATEYFTYTAPPEDGDTGAPLHQAARQLAKALSPAQQVVFIRTPETNLYTLTAKQLASRNALDIFVLQRQTDASALSQQQAAIEQQLRQKPSVHFVKYRTPADVSRALATLRGGYDQLPGKSISHAIESADVFELNPPPPTRPPLDRVIFKILPKDGSEYETHEEANELETAKVQALFREYLPPRQRR